MMPMIPKEQSIKRQSTGMPRKPPKMNAYGTIIAQAIMPKVNSQRLRTGSRNAPINATAITKCPNASQSVPYAMNG